MTFDYVLRRSNGYFVYSTTGSGSSQQEPTKFARNSQEEPVTLAVGKGVIIEGATSGGFLIHLHHWLAIAWKCFTVQ